MHLEPSPKVVLDRKRQSKIDQKRLFGKTGKSPYLGGLSPSKIGATRKFIIVDV
jgi:hypothetical protein